MNTAEICPHFGQCGGCSSQDKSYEEQIAEKTALYLELLTTHNLQPQLPTSVTQSPAFAYRNRMDFVFYKDGPAQRMKKKFNRFVPLETCLIANQGVQDLLQRVRTWFSAHREDINTYHQKAFKGVFKYAVCRSSRDSLSRTITFILNREAVDLETGLKAVDFFVEENPDIPNILIGFLNAQSGESISNDIKILRGDVRLTETSLGPAFTWHSQGFFQNNPHIAADIIKSIRLSLHGRAGGTLIDFYGGVGTFGTALADLFDSFKVVDIEGRSIEAAVKNIEVNCPGKGQALALDAAAWSFSPELRSQIMIADPPRAGLGPKVIAQILANPPRVLYYIACDPYRTAPEITALKECYNIERADLFDMFPQTPHVEALYVLSRKESDRVINQD